MSRQPRLGFKQAIEYVLDVLCFAYYVKSDNLVSDFTFDELEGLYCDLFDTGAAPHRAQEIGITYSMGTEVVYEAIKRRQRETQGQNEERK